MIFKKSILGKKKKRKPGKSWANRSGLAHWDLSQVSGATQLYSPRWKTGTESGGRDSAIWPWLTFCSQITLTQFSCQFTQFQLHWFPRCAVRSDSWWGIAASAAADCSIPESGWSGKLLILLFSLTACVMVWPLANKSGKWQLDLSQVRQKEVCKLYKYEWTLWI